MPKQNHLRLLGNKRLAEITNEKFNIGFGKKEEKEEPIERDYARMTQDVRQYHLTCLKF